MNACVESEKQNRSTPLPETASSKWDRSRLATEALLSFSKKRVEYRGERDGKTVTIALDQVDGLGAYSGPYLEVEVLSHHESEVGEALACVEKVAFELLGAEREMSMSYMEMLKLSRAETPGR